MELGCEDIGTLRMAVVRLGGVVGSHWRSGFVMMPGQTKTLIMVFLSLVTKLPCSFTNSYD